MVAFSGNLKSETLRLKVSKINLSSWAVVPFWVAVQF